MKDWLKNVWKKFEGKKRNIGILLGFVLKGITIFAPDLIPENQVNFIDNGIDLFLVGGLLDSARRTEQGDKFIKSAIKMTKVPFKSKSNTK